MRGCVVVLGLAMSCCAHGNAATPARNIKPRSIPGLCEDPPHPMPDGTIWLRPPCTLYAQRDK